MEAIEINTFLWGGILNPIIPAYKRKPKIWRRDTQYNCEEIIKGYIDAYDPDYVVTVGQSATLKIGGKNRETVPAAEILVGVTDDETPQYGIGLFEILNYFAEKELKFIRRKPLDLCLPDFSGRYSIFMASIFGHLTQDIDRIFYDKYVKSLGFKIKPCSISDYAEFLAPSKLFPRRVISLYLPIRRPWSWWRGQCIFFMDATNYLDIIDCWNLRAIGWDVIPIAKQALQSDKIKLFAVDFIERNYLPNRDNPNFYNSTSLVKSRSTSENEMQDFVKWLEISSPITPGKSKIVIQNWYPRIWDEWARDKDGVDCCTAEAKTIRHDIQDYEGRLAFRTLEPKFMYRFGGRGSPRFANEIDLNLYSDKELFAEVMPEGDRELVNAIGSLEFDAWRFSKRGLVYLARHSDWSIDIALPKAEYIFYEWLRARNWQVEISVPGRFAKQIIKRIGGIFNISLLANDGIIRMLQEMGVDKVFNENAFRAKIAKIANQLNWKMDSNIILQRLINANMFRLGLKIQCPICKEHSWYSIKDLDYELQCKKCQDQFKVPCHSTKDLEWAYRTAEPLGLPNQAHGAYSVLLTLRFFSLLLRGATTPILSFEAKRGENKIEADIGLFFKELKFGNSKTELIFIECKTYDYFKEKDIKKMQFLAQQFPGSIICFATLNKSLTSDEKKLVQPFANRARKYWRNERPRNPLLILTATELFAGSKPPYCWKDLSGKHAQLHETYSRRQFNLFDLCDATQQLYIDMEPWHQWVSQWLTKRIEKRNEIIRKPIKIE